MRFFTSILALVAMLALSDMRAALAFQLSPISQVFEPIGEESTQSYEVINNTDESIAVEVSMVVREMNLHGEESYTPAEDDFLIYPPQMILAPDEVQTVRVTWLGDPEPTQELAYRLVAEQLPINLIDPDAPVPNRISAEVKLAFRYLGSVFIRPQGVAPTVDLVSVEPVTGANGEPMLAVTLNNQGTGGARLSDWQLQLTSQGTTVNLTPALVDEIRGQMILPQHTRQFVIPWPQGLPPGLVTATLQFEG